MFGLKVKFKKVKMSKFKNKISECEIV